MFTQQSNALAQAMALPAGVQQTQAMLQVFANCVQGLRTNGPVNINTAAGNQPPRAGVINAPPGIGAILNPARGTGDNLVDYSNGSGGRPPDSYPVGTWNVNNITGGNVTNNFGGSVSFGGDVFYGDTYRSTNNVNEFRSYNNYTNTTDQSVHNSNVQNWYQNQYTDSSYNDFTTTLQTTQNMYSQNVNNFGGDSYFDNSVNGGSVINQGDVINQGNVHNEGDTYQGDSNTYITSEGMTYTLREYVRYVLGRVFDGGFNNQPAPTAVFRGKVKEITVNVPRYRFDSDACQLVRDGEDAVTANYTPEGTISVIPG
jgi:hypothetical protein